MPVRQTDLQLVGSTLQGGRFSVVSELGKGTFGIVYRVFDTAGRPFACKVLFPSSDVNPREKGSSRRRLERLYNAEVRTHTAVTGHDRIVRLREHFIEHSSVGLLFCFLFDLCLGGTLFEMAGTAKFWRNEAEIKHVFTQVIDGVRHCHSRGVAHRDLKPENILADAPGTNYSLTDFGLATMEKRMRAVGAGSILYTAPESFRSDSGERDYDTRIADVWSLGIILINIVCGIEFVPWHSAQPSDEHFGRFLSDPTRIRLYLPLSSTFLPLLLRILDPNPLTRISLSELRREVQKIPRFLMDDAELAEATYEAREGMRECSHALGVPYTLPPVRQPAERPRVLTRPDSTQRNRRMFSFKIPFRSSTPPSTELITPPDSPCMQQGEGDSINSKKMAALARGFRLLKIF